MISVVPFVSMIFISFYLRGLLLSVCSVLHKHLVSLLHMMHYPNNCHPNRRGNIRRVLFGVRNWQDGDACWSCTSWGTCSYSRWSHCYRGYLKCCNTLAWYDSLFELEMYYLSFVHMHVPFGVRLLIQFLSNVHDEFEWYIKLVQRALW